jgi:competence protein ComGC
MMMIIIIIIIVIIIIIIIIIRIMKDDSKVHDRKGHESPEGCVCSFSLSLTLCARLRWLKRQ